MRDTCYVLAHLDTELELCELSILFWLKKNPKPFPLSVLSGDSVKELPPHPGDPHLSPITFNHLLWQLLSLQGKGYSFRNNLEGFVRC